MRTRICGSDAGFDREPAEVDEGGDGVLPGPGAGEDPGSRVVDILEPVQGCAGNRTPGGK